MEEVPLTGGVLGIGHGGEEAADAALDHALVQCAMFCEMAAAHTAQAQLTGRTGATMRDVVLCEAMPVEETRGALALEPGEDRVQVQCALESVPRACRNVVRRVAAEAETLRCIGLTPSGTESTLQLKLQATWQRTTRTRTSKVQHWQAGQLAVRQQESARARQPASDVGPGGSGVGVVGVVVCGRLG